MHIPKLSVTQLEKNRSKLERQNFKYKSSFYLDVLSMRFQKILVPSEDYNQIEQK